jgi:hypothetical protein
MLDNIPNFSRGLRPSISTFRWFAARPARTTETAAQVVDRLGELSDAGAQHVIVSVRDLADPARLEILGQDVIPQLHALP